MSITGGPCSPVKEGHTALILDPQQTIVNIKWIAARPGQTEQEQSLIKYANVQCDINNYRTHTACTKVYQSRGSQKGP